MRASASEIGIVLYPGVQAACVQGLTDLFGIAARSHGDTVDPAFALRTGNQRMVATPNGRAYMTAIRSGKRNRRS